MEFLQPFCFSPRCNQVGPCCRLIPEYCTKAPWREKFSRKGKQEVSSTKECCGEPTRRCSECNCKKWQLHVDNLRGNAERRSRRTDQGCNSYLPVFNFILR